MGLLEVIGVASILPFMELVSKPDAIAESSMLTKAYDFFNFESHRQMLITFGVALIVLLGITNLFAVLTFWLQFKISWKVAHKFSTRLLLSYLKKPYGYFLNQNTNQIRAYVISEVGTLTGGFIIPTIELISRSFVSIIIFLLLLMVDVKVASMAFLGLGGAYVVIFLLRKNYLREIGKHRIEMNLKRYKSLAELFDGLKTIMVYNKLPFFYKRYEEASEGFTDVQPKYNLVLAAPKYLLEFIAFGSVLGYTIFLVTSGGNIQSAIPRLTLFAVAGYRLLPALQKIFTAAGRIRHNHPILHKLYDDLKLIDGKEMFAPDESTLNYQESIVLSDISFRYQNSEENVIETIDLRINKGEMVAFVGATGSGKTTLVDIIVGLHQPLKGQILIDDYPLRDENIKAWQNKIAYVPQEVFLFDDTIARNISLEEDPDKIDWKALHSASKMADIYDFVTDNLTDQFQSQIGEKGVRLSGGQRQRLGLARALYSNPSVLVLDEATSALDSVTEKGIIETMKSLPGNITKIVIAHRLSTVKYSDNIYVIEDGKIAANGKFQDLVKNNITFQNMVAHS